MNGDDKQYYCHYWHGSGKRSSELSIVVDTDNGIVIVSMRPHQNTDRELRFYLNATDKDVQTMAREILEYEDVNILVPPDSDHSPDAGNMVSSPESPDSSNSSAEITGWEEPKIIELGVRRVLRLALRPSWKDAPDWAQWLAQDDDGVWHWYLRRPTMGLQSWNTWSRYERIYSVPTWRETLEERPHE